MSSVYLYQKLVIFNIFENENKVVFYKVFSNPSDSYWVIKGCFNHNDSNFDDFSHGYFSCAKIKVFSNVQGQ